MDYESLRRYVGKKVRLTLENGFWYKADIKEVNEDSVTFIELKGNSVSVHPKAIIMIEEIHNGN